MSFPIMGELGFSMLTTAIDVLFKATAIYVMYLGAKAINIYIRNNS